MFKNVFISFLVFIFSLLSIDFVLAGSDSSGVSNSELSSSEENSFLDNLLSIFSGDSDDETSLNSNNQSTSGNLNTETTSEEDSSFFDSFLSFFSGDSDDGTSGVSNTQTTAEDGELLGELGEVLNIQDDGTVEYTDPEDQEDYNNAIFEANEQQVDDNNIYEEDGELLGELGEVLNIQDDGTVEYTDGSLIDLENEASDEEWESQAMEEMEQEEINEREYNDTLEDYENATNKLEETETALMNDPDNKKLQFDVANQKLNKLKAEKDLNEKSNQLNGIDSFETFERDERLNLAIEEQEKIAQEARQAYCDDSGNCIDQPSFTIKVNDISPGMDVQGSNVQESVNFALGTIIQKLMIALGSFALLIMTIGAGYIILNNGQDEILNKGKSIFMSGVYSLVVALSSYYLIAIVRFLLFRE